MDSKRTEIDIEVCKREINKWYALLRKSGRNVSRRRERMAEEKLFKRTVRRIAVGYIHKSGEHQNMKEKVKRFSLRHVEFQWTWGGS